VIVHDLNVDPDEDGVRALKIKETQKRHGGGRYAGGGKRLPSALSAGAMEPGILRGQRRFLWGINIRRRQKGGARPYGGRTKKTGSGGACSSERVLKEWAAQKS